MSPWRSDPRERPTRRIAGGKALFEDLVELVLALLVRDLCPMALPELADSGATLWKRGICHGTLDRLPDHACDVTLRSCREGAPPWCVAAHGALTDVIIAKDSARRDAMTDGIRPRTDAPPRWWRRRRIRPGG
jgi:hypothetical protein